LFMFFVRFFRACARFHFASRFSSSSFDTLNILRRRYRIVRLLYFRARLVLAMVSFLVSTLTVRRSLKSAEESFLFFCRQCQVTNTPNINAYSLAESVHVCVFRVDDGAAPSQSDALRVGSPGQRTVLPRDRIVAEGPPAGEAFSFWCVCYRQFKT
jgi:hypothetical protein